MKRTPEELLERLDALLDEYEGAVDKYDRGCFADKYGERLGAYSDKLKALNGDDFDIVSSAYDEHKKDYAELSDDDYVNALEENIKKVIARVWPEAPAEVVEQIAEEAAAETETENAPETEVTVETSDPDVADAVENITSDETKKVPSGKVDPLDNSVNRTTGPWKSPSKSGGRDGHSGLPGTYKPKDTTTSDEECKESTDEIKEVAEATPTKVDDIIAETVTAKPEDVSSEEAEEKDDLADFMADLEKYKGHSAYNFK